VADFSHTEEETVIFKLEIGLTLDEVGELAEDLELFIRKNGGSKTTKDLYLYIVEMGDADLIIDEEFVDSLKNKRSEK
jgi:hypothetical protein